MFVDIGENISGKDFGVRLLGVQAVPYLPFTLGFFLVIIVQMLLRLCKLLNIADFTSLTRVHSSE